MYTSQTNAFTDLKWCNGYEANLLKLIGRLGIHTPNYMNLDLIFKNFGEPVSLTMSNSTWTTVINSYNISTRVEMSGNINIAPKKKPKYSGPKVSQSEHWKRTAKRHAAR